MTMHMMTIVKCFNSSLWHGFIHCHRTWDYKLSFCVAADNSQGHLIASELMTAFSRAQFRKKTLSLGLFNFNPQNSKKCKEKNINR